ncbi:MAG: hypothetical protein GX434_02710 [Peptococcaceae bacterium]|nr:hypothetical protein [Peptococcaceae bacterium]
MNPSLFKDHDVSVPDLKNLESGFLEERERDNNTVRVNIPEIHELRKFTEDIYGGWLGLK